jgi:uncharacterized OB-fold protein
MATIYTETVVHVAPQALVADAPYQIAIITLDDGTHATVRIVGERVAINDTVELIETREGVTYYSKTFFQPVLT